MSKTTIIAEAGVNHNGSFENALRLIDSAKEAKADYVKFQTFKTELNISKTAQKSAYQVENTGSFESQYEMIKKLEFSFDQFVKLKEYCDKKEIGFLSTAFDFPSIDIINQLQDIFKIPSGEITNYPYLKKIASLGKNIILSTGMANMEEIGYALKIFTENGCNKEKITVLHCNTEYPTPFEDVNLKAMNSIAKEFNIKVGYSDHTLGIEVPIAAVALGALVIEKHFTLDRSMSGPDHTASLEPEELKNMVSSIRNIEAAISGSGEKIPSQSEKKNIPIVRKSIYAFRALKKGQLIKESDIVTLRPSSGISPVHWDQIIGKKVIVDIKKFESLTWDKIEK